VALEWQKRCKRADTDVADRRQWWTVCKNYYVEESNIRYGRKRDENNESAGYPIVYRVMIKRVKRDDEYGKRIERFDILAAHKTKRAAVQALDYYVEHRKLPPKQATKTKRRQKAKRQQKAKRKAKKEVTT
jgi:hypothetical protein